MFFLHFAGKCCFLVDETSSKLRVNFELFLVKLRQNCWKKTRNFEEVSSKLREINFEKIIYFPKIYRFFFIDDKKNVEDKLKKLSPPKF